MKVYLAGSISNNENYVKQFSNAEKKLKESGYTVINPVKNLGFTYKEYIDMGLCELSKCDVILLLHGWDKSEGAKLELKYACTVGIKVMFESDVEL